jgi:hypothetical protein
MDCASREWLESASADATEKDELNDGPAANARDRSLTVVMADSQLESILPPPSLTLTFGPVSECYYSFSEIIIWRKVRVILMTIVAINFPRIHHAGGCPRAKGRCRS